MDAPILIFERPGADLVLRQVLEESVSAPHSDILLATRSRFVVLAPAFAMTEGFYRCCETVEDALAALATAAEVFSGDVEEVPVRLVVEPDTRQLLESIIAGMGGLEQAPANDS